ncbi:MAG: hypothetical protein E7617_02215 [Ruminococcaceae bacterium]|nr:hypothetical protein [Oscillospiraceae bacterium]
MNTIKINDHKNTLIVAHRGVSGIELENTLSAFVAAGNRSYYGIESDVHKTADGKFVIIHDDHTGRVSDTRCEVEETDFDLLRSLELHDKSGYSSVDMRIPTLSEYITVCKRYGKVAVLELKNSFTKEEVSAICAEIAELDYIGSTTFISFDFDNLVYVREGYPEATVQFLMFRDFGSEVLMRLAEHRMDLDINYKEVTAELIADCHAHGIRVNAWTVDDPAEADRLISYGIDYITTNILE